MYRALLLVLLIPVFASGQAASGQSQSTPSVGQPTSAPVFEAVSPSEFPGQISRIATEISAQRPRYVRVNRLLNGLLNGKVTIPLGPGHVVQFFPESGRRRAFLRPHNRPLRPNDAEKSGEDLAYSFSGRVYDTGSDKLPNDENQDFGYFTVLGEQFVGQLYSETHLYKIESVSEDFARITEVAWEAIPSVDPGGVDPFAGERKEPSSESRLRALTSDVLKEGAGTPSEGITEINVAVVFANDAYAKSLSESRDWFLDAINAVYYTNFIYEMSGIDVTLRLAGASVIDFQETSNITIDLGRITPDHSDFETPHLASLRDAWEADIVILIGDYDITPITPAYGAAWFAVGRRDNPTGPLLVLEERGYGAVDYDFMDGVAFAHEVGHIFGADHNDEDEVPNNGFHYGRGQRKGGWCPEWICGRKWQTVMSYGGLRNIPYFSTPLREYAGDAVGDASHNNVRVHNFTRPYVGGFRTPPVPPLAVTLSLSGASKPPKQGETVKYLADVSGDQSGLQYEWRKAPIPEAYTAPIVQTYGDSLPVTLEGNTYVLVTVTNSLGESATDELYTYVQSTEVSAKPTLSSGSEESYVEQSDGTIAASGRGVSVPSELAVAVWPNPVQSEARIELSLPEASGVRISVYDVLGRLVESVAAGTFGEGYHVFAFERSNLPSGVYVVHAESNGRAATTIFTLQ